ncbi:MAG: aminotransferase class I/II-fold pyridoxal phosphate-dependent enzyme [Frankiales bacterium]|nr:aminotransferase class I/II-fold pyridoxal phosphate-dependent enzyme [Frankiales bacterium]
MRRAMADADVGDDVYGEDPTVNALEEHVAALFGHPAALFVPSGTMGNQIAVRLIVPPADELICDADAHIVSYEGGGAAQHGGVQTRTLVAERGLLTPEALEPQLRPENYHTVPTRAVAVEQTHNRGGGAVYPIGLLKDLRALTSAYGLALHCDGARIWNAHVASGIALAEYGGLFDTLSVCLSKGLGAPIGSVVVISDEGMVTEARAIRRRLGGGMRQAGVLAAAGRFALEHNISRLAEDHAHAQQLATALDDAVPGLVEAAAVETNIVPLDLTVTSLDSATLAAQCRAEGVLVSAVGPRRVRLVTHLDVDDAAIDRAIDVVSRALVSAAAS